MEQQSEQQEIKNIITSREDGFGHRLKIARNERNLSTADVARELRLDEKIILALENEDHQRLPVSAFVCGYIRNYAKFLNVQPEPLIDCYKKGISDDSLDPELKITKGREVASGIDTSKITAFAIVGFIIAALFLGGWQLWQYLSSNDPVAVDAPSSEAPQSVNASSSPESLADDSLLLPELDEADAVPMGATQEVAEQKAIAGTDAGAVDDSAVIGTDTILVPGDSGAASAPSSQQTPSEESLPSPDTLSSIETPVVVETSQAETALSIPAEPEVAADNQLVLEFSGDSWITIKDADNKKLATGLKRAGQTLKLQGKLPYHVFLGDGRVVKVTIHGQIYDHSRHINDKNIARFEVQ